MRVIFLDRDGVINEYPGDRNYVTGWEGFRFLPKAKAALKKLNKDDYKVFVISNQAGVSKGIYSQQELDKITNNMLREIKIAGGRIDKVFYCIHKDEDNCNCRKPKTGLIQEALQCLSEGTNLKSSPECFFIGDTIRDIKTGKSAGCRTILVFSGKEKFQNKDAWEIQPDYTAKDLYSAVELLSNH